MNSTTAAKKDRAFDPRAFLATIGKGRKSFSVSRKQGIFAQGDIADAVFYIRKGKIKLTVVSHVGKEATIGILVRGISLERARSPDRLFESDLRRP